MSRQQAVFLWLFISQIIMVFWAIRPKSCFFKYDWGERTLLYLVAARVIGISAFFSFFVVLFYGYQKLLAFFPSKWGIIDDSEEWQYIGEYISGFIGLISAGLLIAVLVDYNDRRRKRLLEVSSTISNT